MKANYYNHELDLWVRITGPEFVILGDGEHVTDAELLEMAEGVCPEGWSRCENRVGEFNGC